MRTTKFYLNKASYIAEDNFGNKIDIDIDYWENSFKISRSDRDLENFARKLLKKKHRVNFIDKLGGSS